MKMITLFIQVFLHKRLVLQEHRLALALLHQSKNCIQQVAAATDKVFYHIFLTCKCFLVINIRWLHSLFYTIAQICGSSYTQN